MKQPSHADSFRTATGNPPYDWQRRLAEDPECRPRLIDIPAGLAWQGNRLGREEGDKPWPLAEKSRSGSLPLPPDDANRRAADSALSWLAARSSAIPIGDQMIVERVQPPGCRVGLELTVPPLLKARPEPFDQCLELILGQLGYRVFDFLHRPHGNKIASLGPRFQAPRSKGPRSEERGNMDCSACQLRWISLQWGSRRRKSRKNPLTP